MLSSKRLFYDHQNCRHYYFYHHYRHQHHRHHRHHHHQHHDHHRHHHHHHHHHHYHHHYKTGGGEGEGDIGGIAGGIRPLKLPTGIATYLIYSYSNVYIDICK
jgi:hypothetical protein